MKAFDTQAASIQWGIELETRLPQTSQVPVGNYHAGYPVTTGITLAGVRSNTPAFNADTWKAERDGSIRCEAGQIPCKFVSPILHTEHGVAGGVVTVFTLLAMAPGGRSCEVQRGGEVLRDDEVGDDIERGDAALVGLDDGEGHRPSFAVPLVIAPGWENQAPLPFR